LARAAIARARVVERRETRKLLPPFLGLSAGAHEPDGKAETRRERLPPRQIGLPLGHQIGGIPLTPFFCHRALTIGVFYRNSGRSAGRPACVGAAPSARLVVHCGNSKVARPSLPGPIADFLIPDQT